MKQQIEKAKSQFDPAFGNKAHVQWDFSNYKIQKFSVEFSNIRAKLMCEQKIKQ